MPGPPVDPSQMAEYNRKKYIVDSYWNSYKHEKRKSFLKKYIKDGYITIGSERNYLTEPQITHFKNKLPKEKENETKKQIEEEKKTLKPNWVMIFSVSVGVIISIMFFIFMFRGRQTAVQPTFQQQFRQLPQQLQQMPQQMVQMPQQVMRGGAKGMNIIIKKIKSLFR